ncbi:hypothetical protein ABZ851_11665 [Streptomyces sp. NPDC047049]|uniref:hypothetical protein n=1 Tax=Streptomyces sp. NPDC047049 TaxID=3156688 RepID=UPI0033E8C31E
MTQKTGSRSRAARLALLIAVPALALTTACGGAAPSGEGVASVSDAPTTGQSKDGGSKGGASQGKSAFYDAQMKYVQCLRKNVSKDFPAPKLSGYLDWTKIEELETSMGGESLVKGTRGRVCAPEMRKAMNLEPPRDTQKEYESMLAHAKCMRAHGVSKFTNPQLQNGNVMPGGDANPTSPEVKTDSSTYKEARQACKDKLLDGLDGRQ